ncbi:MAG: CBS domain-containing protein [Nitrospinota bacterium]|nr:CBS domain-containing protein [Nitrospinota bacterium]
MQKHKPCRFAKVEIQQEEIGQYMSTPVISIDANANIKELSEQMESKNIGSLLVKEKEEFVCIITERDITQKIIGKGMDPNTTKVSEIVSSTICGLQGNEAATKANMFMAEKRVRHLAVTDGGKIIRMLSVKDLVSFFANPRLRY